MLQERSNLKFPYGNFSQEINYNPCFTLSINKGNFRESTDNRNYSCKTLSNSHVNTPGKVKAKSSLNLQNYNPCVTLCLIKAKSRMYRLEKNIHVNL